MAIIRNGFTNAASLSDGSVAWSNTGNVFVNNTAETSCNTTSKNSTVTTLRLLGASGTFARIPEITGIEVRITRRKDSSNNCRDSIVRLNIPSLGATGQNKAAPGEWSTNRQTAVYGSSNDLWGLTPVQVQSILDSKSLNFNLGVHIKTTQDRTIAYISYVEILIYYKIREVYVRRDNTWVKCTPEEMRGSNFIETPEIKATHNNQQHVVYLR